MVGKVSDSSVYFADSVEWLIWVIVVFVVASIALTYFTRLVFPLCPYSENEEIQPLLMFYETYFISTALSYIWAVFMTVWCTW